MILLLIVLFSLFVLECIFTEVENFGWATVVLLGSLVAFGVLGHFHAFGLPSLLEFVKDHGVFTLVYVGAYVVVGIVWSFVKWFSYLMSFRDAFRQQKEAFFKSKGMGGLLSTAPVPTELQAEFKEFVQHNARWTSEHRNQLFDMERPRASKNKARITAWASFWPFSFVGTLLNDPVRRLFNLLFNWFKALYQQMSDWVFRKDSELK